MFVGHFGIALAGPVLLLLGEVAIFIAGTWIYAGSTRAKDAIGRYGFWSWIVFLFAGWVSTLFAGAPPSVKALPGAR